MEEETRKKEAEAQTASLSKTIGSSSHEEKIELPSHKKLLEQNLNRSDSSQVGENKEDFSQNVHSAQELELCANNHANKTKITSKNKRKPRQKQTQFNDSITGVNPVRTHGFGVYKGRRVVWAVRVDETLLNKAKPVLKAKFGSTCRGIEAWLAGLVATYKGDYELGVYPSNTVEIGKLVIERNIRSRRKMVVEETEVTEKVTVCGHVNCNEVAVGSGLWRKKQSLPLCEDHLKEAQVLFWEWSDVKLLEVSP